MTGIATKTTSAALRSGSSHASPVAVVGRGTERGVVRAPGVPVGGAASLLLRLVVSTAWQAGARLWQPRPPLVAATLQGTYLALNLATAAQPVQLTLQGTLLASNGTIGRTSFRESVSGQLPAGPGVIPSTPPALGTVSFTVANLQPGRWRVQAASNVAATVNCDVVVPGVLRISINATGDAGYGPVCT